MSILDKAKTAAGRAPGQARHAAAQSRARLMEVQARRQHSKRPGSWARHATPSTPGREHTSRWPAHSPPWTLTRRRIPQP
jgi:hypothetical protein